MSTATSGSTPVFIRLLGPFSIDAGVGERGRVVVKLRKARALVAYLAMQGELSASREKLAALLWGENAEGLARQSLRQTLMSLRQDLECIPGLLVIEREIVMLNADCVTVDARELAALAGTGGADQPARIVALYRGEFLADLTLDIEPFDDWRRHEGERLRAIAASALEALAHAFDHGDDGDRAIGAADRLVALDPVREDWQRIDLELWARHRGREAALSRAKVFADRLKRELDVTPQPETLALIEAIRSGGVSRRPVPVTQSVPPEIASDPRPAVRLTEATPRIAGTGAAADISGASVASYPSRRDERRTPRWRAVAAAAIFALVLLGAWLGLSAGIFTHQAVVAASDSAWHSPPMPETPGSTSAQRLVPLVVLPFTSDRDGKEPTPADRVTADLIFYLAHTPALRVINAPTTRFYRGKAIEPREVAAELDVRYAVIGDVRTNDDRIEIGTALIDVASGAQVWSHQFSYRSSERFAAVSAIVEALCREFGVEMADLESLRASPKYDPVLDGLLARGWVTLFRHNIASTTGEAEAIFREALKRDGENASALAGLAAHYVVSVSNLYEPVDREAYLAKAEDLLHRAIAKNANLSAAFYFLGLLRKTQGDLDAALDAFGKALRLNPSMSMAYAQIGHILGGTGHAEEAMQHIRYALRLSPRDASASRYTMFAGQIELERGHAEAAIEWLSRAVAINPHSPRIHATLAAAFALNGQMASATEHVAEVKKLAPWGIDPSTKLFVEPFTDGIDARAPRFFEGWRLAMAAVP